jgi:hypothetical protein
VLKEEVLNIPFGYRARYVLNMCTLLHNGPFKWLPKCPSMSSVMEIEVVL